VPLHLVAVFAGLMIAGQTASTSYLSEKCAEQIREAVETGNRIYEEDQIAARATDALFEAVDVGKGLPVHGWITVRRGDAWLVRFITTVSGQHRAVYDVHLGVDFAATVEVRDPPQPLEKDDIAMFQARQSALGAIPFQCTEKLNTVVLPSTDGDRWIVYVLGATTVPGEIVVGGHFRATVSQDGSEVFEMAKLSEACLTLNPWEDAKSQGEGEPVGAFVTHILSETPIETHVFLSRVHDIPLFVITQTGIWIVDDGTIRYESPLPEDDKETPEGGG
jgi:hypothetical protein